MYNQNDKFFEADVWHCKCTVEGVTSVSKVIGSSKKNAKKKAAYYMLREIYENKL